MVTTISIDNHDFLVRNIAIFEDTPEKLDVMVGSTALKHYLSNNCSDFTQKNQYSSIDEQICYYAQPMQLIKMSDDELRKLVEESY